MKLSTANAADSTRFQFHMPPFKLLLEQRANYRLYFLVAMMPARGFGRKRGYGVSIIKISIYIIFNKSWEASNVAITTPQSLNLHSQHTRLIRHPFEY